jgi:HEPN domain-containing protein
MLRKQTDDKDPADWFAFAEDRLRSADVLWNHEGLTATGIEILQEAVERYLKGYLVANQWKLVKTHDLERLLREAVRIEPAFDRFKFLATELTEDFFAQHYPGEDTTELGSNYEKMREQAGELLALIQHKVPKYFSKS